MKKGKAIKYMGLVEECTEKLIRHYLRKRGFDFRIEECENIFYELYDIYDANEFSEFVKKVEVEYDAKAKNISVFVDYGNEEFSNKLEFEYNVDDARKEHKKNYKPLEEIIIEGDGRIRFAGEINVITRFTAQGFDTIEAYHNKFQSDMNNIKVYFEGDMVNGLPQGPGKLVWNDGSLLYDGEFKDGNVTGFGRSYFLSGSLSSEGYRINGIENGEFIQYFENGQVESKGIMKDGELIGYGISYYEDGRLYYKGEYGEDGWCKDGLIYYIAEGVAFKENDDGIFLVDKDGNIISKISKGKLKKLQAKYKANEAC